MATTDTTTKTNTARRLPVVQLLGLAALLAPLSYLAGRVSLGYLANTYLNFLANGLITGALGMMIGIPVGLFFGTMRRGSARPAAATSALELQQPILQQIRAELAEDQTLFEARKGHTDMYARIDYLTSFWETIKASGRLLVISDTALLTAIGTAYYWLDQANRLELMAYEAKNTGKTEDGRKLVQEARLLDGQLENSLAAALSGIDSALAS